MIHGVDQLLPLSAEQTLKKIVLKYSPRMLYGSDE